MIALNGRQILKDFPKLLTYICGDQENQVLSVSSVSQPSVSCLCYASSLEQIENAISAQAGIIIFSGTIDVNHLKKHSACLLQTSHLQMAMAKINSQYFTPDQPTSQVISSTATIGPNVTLPQNIYIGPGAAIGTQVQLGENTSIHANAVIEDHAQIGVGTSIAAHAVIGHHCIIGQHCFIQSHAVIGSDGYGFAQDSQGKSHKIPQLGIVRMEDHVEIGALCAIDRATFNETVIGEGTKIDNHCHIAHNCQIGKHCLITAGFAIAGSSKIGNHFVAGGKTSITDHVEICDNVQLAALSVVLKNITEPGTYGGDPLEPIKDYLRTKQNLRHLTKMRRLLNQLLKK